MRFINLTMPLSSKIDMGYSLPWDSPFRTEEITNYSVHDARLFHICSGSETGTRLISPRFFLPDKSCISDIPLSDLVNRPTSVITISKTEGVEIDVLDLERGFDEAKIHSGDAILIRTGWGEEERYKNSGEKYTFESPFFTAESARLLIRLMEKFKSNLLLTDCVYLDKIGKGSVRKDWGKYPVWLRPPYPSEQAKAYLQRNRERIAREEWVASKIILDKCWSVLALLNCGEIESKRVQITCLPMFVVNAGSAPCTVIATELDYHN